MMECMKGVRCILMGLLLAGSVFRVGATEEDSLGISRQDPYYFQFYGGINKSANEHLPWSEFSRYPWSGGLFVGFGKEITPVWGWRLAFRYNHNKSRNVPRCEWQDTWKWQNVGLFADATFDLTDALFNEDSESAGRFNLKAFAGVGAVYTFDFPKEPPLSYTHAYSKDSLVLGAFRAGLTATYQVSSRWRIGAELSHTLFMDRFNGVKTGFPLDGRTNLKVGLTYLFGPKPRKQQPQAVVPYDHRLKVIPPLPLLIPAPEERKIRQVAGRAFLDFPVNETVIYPDYRRNPEELKRISASIDSALFDKSMRVLSISLHGYASPEGTYVNNVRLAEGRTRALRDYLRQRYQLSDSLFHTGFTPEDWQNLRDFLVAGSRRRVKADHWYAYATVEETPEMPEIVWRHREALLKVIDNTQEWDAKEQTLKQVGGGEPYAWLLRHVYPGLRHTDYVIEYEVQPYPVKDGRKLIYTHPSALSLQEMYFVAKSYKEGSDGWMDALLIAAQSYPEDEQANLNAACACVQKFRLTDAKAYLEKAGDSKDARYLRRVIRAMEGEGGWRIESGRIIIEDY